MKKIYMILAAMTLLSMSLNAQLKATKNGTAVQPTTMRANTPNGPSSAPMRGTKQATVCDGTNTNSYLPVYGLYVDNNYQVNQMIYPASELTNLVGKTITSMTFYTSSTIGANLGGSTWTVKLGTTTQTTFSYSLSDITRLVPSDVVAVAQGIHLPTGGTTMTITFSTPFTYTGNNLLVDFEETAYTSRYASTSFIGVDQPYGTYTGYNSYGTSLSNGHYGTGYGRNFLPKVTFTYESEDHDLAIALSAPTTAGAGSTVDVTATVTNNGDFAENGYTVTVSDGTNIVNITAQEALGIGETTTFTVQFPINANASGSTVNFTATVACTGDDNTANNSATASTSILNLPPPENVTATATGNNGTMTWDAPSTMGLVPSTLLWDFEEEADFNAFTAIDYDGDGYNWGWRYNTHESGTDLDTHSGDGVIYSQSYDKPTGTVLYPDNWLISPKINLGGKISFWACGQDPNQYWNEVFAVYVCVGSYNNVLDFIKISPDITTTHDMTQYTFDLGQYSGQGYFAIRHYNVHDEFYLNVDDIEYTGLNEEQPISYNIYLDGQLVGYVDANTFSYTFNNVSDGEHECAVSAVYPGGYESAAVPATFTITSLPTPNAPTVTPTTGDANVTISITPDPATDGQLVYYVDYNGSQTQDLTFPRGETDYQVTVHAYTEATANYNQSPEAVVPVTIPALPQTAAPTIAISSQTDNEVVITATGNGTVTLTINGQTVEGEGSASITLPRQMQDYNVTASATAQVSGELISPTTTETITVPGMSNDGWTQMTGTYNNPNALLSFKVKVGNDTTDIMLIDQFMASTVHNDHPNGYTYVLKETKVINGVDSTMTSNPATVPVYKTNSTMYSLYTEDEVLADNKYDDNKLKANVLNSEIDYDVVPDNNVLYYSLYRGGKDEPTPVVDVDHRISQLQKFEDKVGDNVTYYLTENHLSGITPRYEHIGSQIVERLDQDYVTGTETDKLSYVPVIWTFGLYTARGDGKNNSYGSDIKNSYVGKVNISVEGYKNDGNNTTGQWKDGEGTTYCVYSPKITLNGFTPDDGGANDDDTYQYVPYMYRVWCTYPNAHNFTLLANPDGKVHLADAGPITAPFLIGEATAKDSVWHNNGEEVIIGRALASGEAQQPWSFGVPVNESSKNVEFVARFYYKKIVTPAAQANGLRGNRGSERAFAIAENSADGKDIVTGINELADIVYVVSTTYVNAQGMQSDVPFDGLNIVITRYSDGTTSTTKVVR